MKGMSGIGLDVASVGLSYEGPSENSFAPNNYWLAPELKSADALEVQDYGISKCIDSAKRVFPPSVLIKWPILESAERVALIEQYSDMVAKNFGLECYQGVVVKKLDMGVAGLNNGDGKIYLDTFFVENKMSSPLQIVDVITHELRHQFQSECVEGHHSVPDSLRKEWKTGLEVYTDSEPFAYDPWGYEYNALELDARYAGETVVREFSKDYRA